MPESVDLFDLADRCRGLVGHGRHPGSRGVPFGQPPGHLAAGRLLGAGLQWGFALLVLRVPAGVRVLSEAGKGVEAILDCALAGAEFVFGTALVDPKGPARSSSPFGCCRR